MNVNSIVNSTNPLFFYEKEKDTRDTNFMDILARTAKEAYAQQEAKSAETAQYAEKILSENDVSDLITDEQLDYLASKYDVNSIRAGSREERELLNELADMGIIHKRNTAVGLYVNVVAVEEGELNSFIPIEETSFYLLYSNKVQPASDRMIDKLMATIATQDKMSEHYKLRENDRAFEISDSHSRDKQNVLAILQSISARRAQLLSGGDIQ